MNKKNRPYRREEHPRLRELFFEDKSLSKDILFELSFRKSPGAKQLKIDIDLEIKTGDLYFSERVKNCLKYWNVNCVADLIDLSRSELMQTPNMGIKSLREVEDRLKENGLYLRNQK